MQIMHLGNMRFTVTELRLLEVLGQEGSLSSSADRVGLSQPAASHALSHMRKVLADPLFVRTSGGLKPTPYGRRICDAAHKALQALRIGITLPRFDAASSTRVFNLYMSDVGQIVLLPPLLARLKREAPHISLHVRSIPQQSPHSLLETGEVDLAVGYLTTLTTGFYQKRLLRERYVCVVHKDHPAFASGMNLRAFQSVPHALTDSTGMAHQLLDRKLARQGIQRSIKLYVPQFMVLPLLVASSDLLVVMPSRLAANFATLLPLKVMPLPVTVPPYEVKLYWHTRFRQDPANRWLRSIFVELFSDSGVTKG